MNRWQGFLDSLATKGGNIAILICASTVLLVASVFIMLKFGANIPTVSLVAGSYGNFQGALLMALVGKDRSGVGTVSVTNNASTDSTAK